MIYFTADLHFGHKNIVRYCNRYYPNGVVISDDDIINNINLIVQENDTLIVLGDFSLANNKQVRGYRNRINCRKVILVQGNHDKQITNAFDLVVQRVRMIIAKRPVLLSHYQYQRSWWKRFFGRPNRLESRFPKNDGAYLLHGHVHKAWKFRDKMYNVGVDVNNYKPVSIKEIETWIQRKEQEK